MKGDKRMVDSDLIKRCQQGEEEAYDELYKTVGKKALWTTYLLAGNMNIAEDIIQEVFFECFRSINKLQKPELFPVWFNRILTRTCWRIVYKEKKKAAKSLDDEVLVELKIEDDDFERIEINQTNLKIREAINRLSPSMRATVILHYYNEMTIKEIAQVMNCFEGTVKSRLYYAKKVLGKELKRELADEYFQDLNYQKRSAL